MDQDVVPFAAVPHTSASAALLVPITTAHVDTQAPAAARAARRRHPVGTRNMCSPFVTVGNRYRPGAIPEQRLRQDKLVAGHATAIGVMRCAIEKMRI